ncbi:MAG: collagen-like protein [Bacteroidetes bacterium]|nr:collagen-like protein [Bacteroidota bacterium]
MKRILTFSIALLLSTQIFSQAPEMFNYQAVCRTSTGVIIANQPVAFLLTIHDLTASGSVLYSERQTATTNAFGLVNLQVGSGIIQSGVFASIPWGTGSKFLEVGLDASGGTTYVAIGTPQLLSVPYAMYANQSGTGGATGPTGPQGIPGNDGAAGIQGPTGPQGLTGNDGAPGIPGNDGAVGPQGPTGAAGIDGSVGAQGPTGPTGAIGPQGPMGVQGLPGNDGAVGPQGPTGAAGSNGSVGAQGPIGPTGLTGPIGATGATGAAGAIGLTGPIGPTGFLGSGTSAGNTSFWDGTNWILNNSNIFNNGGNVGIGTVTPGTKLEINGQIKITGGTPGAGKVLSSDATGLASWTTPATVPTVSGTTNYISKFTAANAIGNSLMQDNGTSLSIGTISPSVIYQLYAYRQQLTVNGDGQATLYGYRTRDSQNDGISYAQISANSATTGFNFWGDVYTFGVAGWNYNDYNRCGGTFGADVNGAYWGSLGYRSSGLLNYGVYGSAAYANGAGKVVGGTTVPNGIGGGFYGDLFGADIHGSIYGTYTEGGNYGLYSNGNIYTNSLNIQLQEVNNQSTQKSSSAANNMAVLYTNVSTDVTVQTAGTAKMVNGTCQISFDKTFSSVISSQIPLVVTVTPTGNSNGVYVSEVNSNGFTVRENNNGTSNVNVSFIVMGRRAGYENPLLPAEVISKDYTSKIARGLHNDGDKSTDGEGLYFENGQLKVGVHPSNVPDLSKKPKEVLNQNQNSN